MLRTVAREALGRAKSGAKPGEGSDEARATSMAQAEAKAWREKAEALQQHMAEISVAGETAGDTHPVHEGPNWRSECLRVPCGSLGPRTLTCSAHLDLRCLCQRCHSIPTLNLNLSLTLTAQL